MRAWFSIPGPALLLAVLLLPPAAVAADLRITLPECRQPVLVSRPEGFDAERKWPGVFHYHGLNGRPDTALVRAHTGAGDWIVVGMAYVQEGQQTVTVESLKAELAVFRQVRDRLVAEMGLDPGRVFLCGVSKGGWMVDHLLQAERTLAGGAVLMAGHIANLPEKPVPLRAGTPVFIGVGRRDGNFPFALRALQFHRQRGASVHIETWDGLAHEFPREGSAGLREWFARQLGRMPDAGALDAELAQVLAQPPRERWWQLVRFKERPAVAAEGTPWLRRADEALAAIAADPAVAREAAVYQEHRRLLAREIAVRTAPDLEAVVHAFMELAAKAEGTLSEEAVEIDLERVQKLRKQVEAQRPARPAQPERPEVTPPEFPDSRPRIPRNPLVR